MSEPFVPRAGPVFSADIAVPEHAREVRFYSRVGRQARQGATGEDGEYVYAAVQDPVGAHLALMPG